MPIDASPRSQSVAHPLAGSSALGLLLPVKTYPCAGPNPMQRADQIKCKQVVKSLQSMRLAQGELGGRLHSNHP